MTGKLIDYQALKQSGTCLDIKGAHSTPSHRTVYEEQR